MRSPTPANTEKPPWFIGDVVDQLHDDHRLADAGAAEQADLASLGVGREQVNDLDARDEDLGGLALVRESGRGAVDGELDLGLDLAALVNGLADHVHDAPESLGADRDGDRVALVAHGGAAREPVRPVHGHGTHRVLAEVLRHLEHEPRLVVLDLERVENLRQRAVELHVDDGADDLGHLARGLVGHAARARGRGDGFKHLGSEHCAVLLVEGGGRAKERGGGGAGGGGVGGGVWVFVLRWRVCVGLRCGESERR